MFILIFLCYNLNIRNTKINTEILDFSVIKMEFNVPGWFVSNLRVWFLEEAI